MLSLLHTHTYLIAVRRLPPRIIFSLSYSLSLVYLAPLRYLSLPIHTGGSAVRMLPLSNSLTLSASLSLTRIAPLRCLSLSLLYTRAVQQYACCRSVSIPQSTRIRVRRVTSLFLSLARIYIRCRPRGRRTATLYLAVSVLFVSLLVVSWVQC